MDDVKAPIWAGCTQCNAIFRVARETGLCPVCGSPSLADAEKDHRGVLLPVRTPVGGIIIPQ